LLHDAVILKLGVLARNVYRFIFFLNYFNWGKNRGANFHWVFIACVSCWIGIFNSHGLPVMSGFTAKLVL
jgi:hypothetical protein